MGILARFMRHKANGISTDEAIRLAESDNLREALDSVGDTALDDVAGKQLDAINTAAKGKLTGIVGNAAARKASILKLLAEWQDAVRTVDVPGLKESADDEAHIRKSWLARHRSPRDRRAQRQPRELQESTAGTVAAIGKENLADWANRHRAH